MVAGAYSVRFRFAIGEGRNRKDIETRIVVIVSPDATSRLIDLRNAPNDHRWADPRRIPDNFGRWERVN